MGYMSEKLWDLLGKKVEEEDAAVGKERQIGGAYVAAVRQICEYGVQRAETIRDTFPMFTLHNETHICNVMRLMAELLGNDLDKLTRDETAMLIMSACCHDIGMSCSEEEKKDLLGDIDRLNRYLERNHHEYVKAYSAGRAEPVMTDDMIQNYLRSIHHERVMELLNAIEWPRVLRGKIDREDLICVCQSHGRDISSLDALEETSTIDLRFCAVMLRLADIMDFDTSRAPEAVYQYSGFQKTDDPNALKSKEEWDKHMASEGFDFLHIRERVHMYSLEYNAVCGSMQVEQTINCYLDWVDQELNHCGRQLKRFAGRWQDFILPGKIRRNITSEGYVSGQYRLSLDQDKILELFIGKDLYSDPSVFVRELIQNAIDAVRTREQLDKSLPSGWKGQINIRCWMDEEGYHWFRIEDNGIGMTEEIIMNYFLKIGSSYYASDAFTKSKLQCNTDAGYMPISRFGIGILSCFMGDDRANQVEISTKHFKEGTTSCPALRLSMHGINGYFYLSNKDKGHSPGAMKGVTKEEKQPYLTQAGTVIAVRTNLYQTGSYRGFKEIVDKYVIYPPVAVHYDGEDGCCDYLTEDEFTNALDWICSPDGLGENGEREFEIPREELDELYRQIPEISFKTPPKLVLKCISLKDYTSTPFLRGAVLMTKVEWEDDPIDLKVGNENVRATVTVGLNEFQPKGRLGINISVRFSDEFERQMEHLKKEYLRWSSSFLLIKSEMELQHPDDFIKMGILKKIFQDNINSAYWKESFIEKYRISEEKLNEAINEVKKFIKCNGYSDMEEDDISTLERYEALSKIWIFDICSLSEFKWYNKYFGNIINKVGTWGIVAHNGISCGDADFFCQTGNDKDFLFYNYANLSTIVLFKDKYRPYLDVARDGVRDLTLETASELEIIKNILAYQGFTIEGKLSELRVGNDSYIVMADYCNLLDERNDLAKQLVFDTSEGLLSNESLADKLLYKEKIELRTYPNLSNKHYSYIRNKQLYKNLCAAFLRENYQLEIKIRSDDSPVFISKKEKELSDDYKKLFPACFFLPDINKNTAILTTKDVYYRYACNEYHRLSQFIINNGVELKKYVPGIFKEFLRTLAEDERDELIHNVNSLLENLRKYPGGRFEVPDELFLSEKDLI